MMDIFLNQSDAIVSSIVVAEKKSLSSANNIVDTVVNILGKFVSFCKLMSPSLIQERGYLKNRTVLKCISVIFLFTV